MDLSRLNNFCKMNIMRESYSYPPTKTANYRKSPRVISSAEPVGNPQSRMRVRHGICLPPPLTQEEFSDIKRCFRRANSQVEGYLDCKELKIYMDLRRCPITHWEAEKLLEYSDPAYHYYISLDQIVELATLYGIGTHYPVQMTRSDFETAIKHAFRVTSSDISLRDSQSQLEDRRSFGREINYIEARANDIRDDYEYSVDNVYPHRDNQESIRERNAQDASHQFNDTFHFVPQSNQQGCIDEEPQEPVYVLKKKWESMIQQELNFHFKRSSENGSCYVSPDSSWIKVKNNQQQVDISPGSDTNTFPDDSTQMKSIYKRENPSKSSSTTELLRTEESDEEARQQLKQTMKNIETAYEDKYKNKKPSRTSVTLKSCIKVRLPPPLPPPIVPDVPDEWKSSKPRSSRKNKTDVSKSVSIKTFHPEPDTT